MKLSSGLLLILQRANHTLANRFGGNKVARNQIKIITLLSSENGTESSSSYTFDCSKNNLCAISSI